MTDRRDEAGAKSLGEEAAAWVVRLAGDDIDEADWLAFVVWLDDAPSDRPAQRREAFDRAQAIWLDSDHLRATFGTAVPDRRRRMSTAPSRRRAVGWAAAAAACCGALLAGLLVQPRRPVVIPQTAASTPYSTAAGERRSLHLPDGSRIELDGATSLSVDLHGPDRRVTMAHGEASFDVTHIPSRSFVVDLGAAQVRVLGTAFDIVRETDAIEVDVARGAVQLDGRSSSARLPAGQGARIDSRGAISLVATPFAEVGAWREGRRLYRAQPLSDVVSDLNRSYAQPLRLADARVGRMPFTGVLVLGPREVVVRRLTALLPLVASPQAGGEIVLSSRHR